jgi:6-phosphogluconolactonase
MSTDRELRTFDDPAAVAHAAADLFASCAAEAIARDGLFRVALSGGSTPKLLYANLVAAGHPRAIDWERVAVYFSDERFVPPSSSDSNFHTAEAGLLSRVPIDPGHTYPVPTVDVQPDEAARQYEDAIRRTVPGDPIPRFDLIFLGMGPDGHTASLFPESAALNEHTRLVAPNFVDKLDAWRITFTYPLLLAARTVVFLVAGQDKATALGGVFRGKEYPAERVRSQQGAVIWMVDSAAASEIPRR